MPASHLWCWVLAIPRAQRHSPAPTCPCIPDGQQDTQPRKVLAPGALAKPMSKNQSLCLGPTPNLTEIQSPGCLGPSEIRPWEFPEWRPHRPFSPLCNSWSQNAASRRACFLIWMTERPSHTGRWSGHMLHQDEQPRGHMAFKTGTSGNLHPPPTSATRGVGLPQPRRGGRRCRVPGDWCAAWHRGCGSCWCSPSGRLWGPAASGWSQLSSPWLCVPAARRTRRSWSQDGRKSLGRGHTTEAAARAGSFSHRAGGGQSEDSNKFKYRVLEIHVKKKSIFQGQSVLLDYLLSSKHVFCSVQRKGRRSYFPKLLFIYCDFKGVKR